MLTPRLHLATARRQRAAGFSLVELMMSLGIMSGVVLLSSSVVLMHAKMYYERLASIDTDQSAQTIINLLQSSGQRAGFGFGHGLVSLGVPAIGQCGPATPPNPYAMPAQDCAHRDNDGRNDRLRIAYVDPWLLYYGHANASTAGPCPGGSHKDPSVLHIPPQSQTGYSTNNQSFRGGNGFNMFIGGQCDTGGGARVFGTSGITLLNDAYGGDGCAELRTYNSVVPSPPGALACSGGFLPGWTMGLAETLDFFTEKDDATNTMQLKLRQQSWGPNTWPIASGVTRFEVRYGLDLKDAPTGAISLCPGCTEDPYTAVLNTRHAWCRDLRAPQDGGDCDIHTTSGQAISMAERYSRIVALHVTFDLSRSVRPGGSLGHAATATTETDSYQTVVALQNLRSY